MTRRLVFLIAVALALGTAGALTAFAMTGHNPGTGVPVTSIDDIDPDQCNLVHNINACTPDEIQGLMGVASVITSVDVVGEREPAVVGVLVSGQGRPEPLFVDGELVSPPPLGQPACGDGEGGAAVYVTAEGETGCVATGGDQGDFQQDSLGQPPHVEPQVLPVASEAAAYEVPLS